MSQCQRCAGLMTTDYLFEVNTSGWVQVLKCISCGDRRDPLIDAHRAMPPITTDDIKAYGPKHLRRQREAMNQHVSQPTKGRVA